MTQEAIAKAIEASNKDCRKRGPELLRVRLAEKTEPGPNGCMLWIGVKGSSGYGRMWSYLTRRMEEAHRLSYALHVGPIPPDHFIDHICKRSDCINPKHLRAVTPRTNAVFNSWSPTALNREKTRCKNGHSFDEKNTRLVHARTKLGEPVIHRRCRECNRVRCREAWARKGPKRNAVRRDRAALTRIAAILAGEGK